MSYVAGVITFSATDASPSTGNSASTIVNAWQKLFAVNSFLTASMTTTLIGIKESAKDESRLINYHKTQINYLSVWRT